MSIPFFSFKRLVHLFLAILLLTLFELSPLIHFESIPSALASEIFSGRDSPRGSRAYQAGTCTNPANITTAAELDACITWANSNAGTHTLTLGANITLSAALPHITSAIGILGTGHSVDGNHSVGVFYVESGGSLMLDTIALQNGSADYGGGIYNDQGTVTVYTSTFSGNSAVGSGGGIYNNYGTVTMWNSTLSNNSTTYYDGGGIYNYMGTVTVNTSTLSGNSASYGGGINNYQGTLTITTNTLSGNSATNDGGGIYNDSGTLYLAGTLLDTGASGGNCYNSGGTITDNGYNLSDDGSCSFGGTGSMNSATLNLGTLAYNDGGSTQTHFPGAGSAAIGRIPYGTTVDNHGVTLACKKTTIDQNNMNRPRATGDACTSGSVEVAVTTCSTPTNITTTAGLDACIQWAYSHAGADTLTLGANITLSGALTPIASAITINGTGHVVDGNHSVRVLWVRPIGNLTLNTITLQNGSADFGSGIYNEGTLTVTNSTLSGNSATNGYGGGILNDVGALTVTNSTLSGNSATNGGGGIYSAGTLTVTNSTLSGNSATILNGGGIYNADGTLTVTNSTFSGNSATDYGGGIFSDNGTIYLAGTLLDTGASADNCYNDGGTITDNGYNLSDDGSCSFSGTGSMNSATLNLGTLAYNDGGSTRTHLPGQAAPQLAASPTVRRLITMG